MFRTRALSSLQLLRGALFPCARPGLVHAQCPCARPGLVHALGGPARRYRVEQRSYWQALRRRLLGPPEPPYRRPCLVGTPVLRAVPADQVRGPEVQRLVHALVAALRRADAVGLSAPQLGVALRVLVLEVPERVLEAENARVREARDMVAVPLRVIVNPRIRVVDPRPVLLPEACHSLPGIAACVARHRAVEVTGLDEQGQPLRWTVSGWTARILQHEVDHLDGRLFIDLMDSRTFQNLRWQEALERASW
ncbi:peptide deformylase, mitochondrial isoform X1 [Amblyraja radiata]|uniref:peptide deformylase, mitochondrial isoform X1 n=1 Tax=Amblyraja radiata TaxID=386614 RepID=UPI0014033F64|nr:peptide deformylase, mitochondrial isoform X1 [Amblyraja radiata]